jgi:hypothetical protein
VNGVTMIGFLRTNCCEARSADARMTLRMAIPIAPIAPRDPVTALFALAFPEAALII